MPRLVLLALLASGCAGTVPVAHTIADVPRDARGEPVLAAIATAPATRAPSCRHYKRCL